MIRGSAALVDMGMCGDACKAFTAILSHFRCQELRPGHERGQPPRSFDKQGTSTEGFVASCSKAQQVLALPCTPAAAEVSIRFTSVVQARTWTRGQHSQPVVTKLSLKPRNTRQRCLQLSNSAQRRWMWIRAHGHRQLVWAVSHSPQLHLYAVVLTSSVQDFQMALTHRVRSRGAALLKQPKSVAAKSLTGS